MARLVSGTPLVGLQSFQTQQAMRSQMLQQAASMTPDNEAIVEVLSDLDAYGPDIAPLQNHIYNAIGGFMEKYRQNPFYAFTREGRNTVANLQRIASSPDFKNLEAAKAATDEEFKRVNDLKSSFVVEGGGRWVNVLVPDPDTGRVRVQRKSVDSVTPEDRIATIGDEESLVKLRIGTTGYLSDMGRLPSYNMADLEDIDQRIARQFTDVRTHTSETEQTVDGVTYTTKQKTPLIEAGVRSLMQGGLGEKDMNTLFSEYLAQGGDLGPGAQAKFRRWVENRVRQYAEGKGDSLFSQTSKVSAQLRAAESKQSLTAKSPYLVAAAAFPTSQYAVRGNNSVNVYAPSSDLPIYEILKDAPKYRTENGSYEPVRRIMSLPLSGALDMRNAELVFAEGNDDLGKQTAESLKIFDSRVIDKFGSMGDINTWVIDDNPAVGPKIVRDFVDFRGNSATLDEQIAITDWKAKLEDTYASDAEKWRLGQNPPPEVAKFLLRDSRGNLVRDDEGRPQLNTRFLVDLAVLAPVSKGFAGKKFRNKGFVDLIDAAGYDSTEDLVNNYITGYGANELDKGLFAIDDEVARVHIRIPMTSRQAAIRASGVDPLNTKEENDVIVNWNMGISPRTDPKYFQGLQQQQTVEGLLTFD